MSGGYILMSLLTAVADSGTVPIASSSQTTAVFASKVGCKTLQEDMIPNPTSTTDTKREYVYTEGDGIRKIIFTHKVFCNPVGD